MKRGEQLIEKYFHLNISDIEMEELNTILVEDKNLAAQFDFEKNVQRAIQETEFSRLEDQMDKFETEIDQETEVKVIPLETTTNPKYRFWSIAASAAFLICLGYFAIQFFSNPNLTKLADNYSSVYPNTEYNITRGETTEDDEYKAFAAYEQGNYKIALTQFLKIPEQVQQDYISFYMANAYFNQGLYEDAIVNYNSTISQNTVFVAESYWYLALSYLKLENEVEAKETLTTLVNDYTYKNEDAKELLRKLK